MRLCCIRGLILQTILFEHTEQPLGAHEHSRNHSASSWVAASRASPSNLHIWSEVAAGRINARVHSESRVHSFQLLVQRPAFKSCVNVKSTYIHTCTVQIFQVNIPAYHYYNGLLQFLPNGPGVDVTTQSSYFGPP